MRRRRVPTVVFLLVAGCARLERSALWDPDAHAPPAVATPWTPPEPMDHYMPPRAEALASAALVPDPEHVHDLVDLIDLAERANPDTRRAWEEARAAAARLGRVESRYLPVVALAAVGGWQREVKPTPEGTEIIQGSLAQPTVDLTWLLVDFGRREADRESARQELVASSFAFNRRHQEVAFAVERSFYAFDASRAEVLATEATLRAADAILEASVARRQAGLATEPEVLLARQQQAEAAFELERARGLVEDAHAALAEAVGIPPTVPLRVSDLAAQPLPGALAETVESVIDGALANRPDLAARLATLRAREAEIRRARAEFFPRIGVTGEVGGVFRDYRAGRPFSSHTMDQPIYTAFLGVEWKLFDGWERENALREARAQAGVARADLAALELRALREIWKAYADVKTALRKYEYATALLRASEDAYASTMDSYRAGVGTFLDLLAAQRELARARTTVVTSRADLLTSSAALAFAAGQMPPMNVADAPAGGR